MLLRKNRSIFFFSHHVISKQTMQEGSLNLLGVLACGYMQIQFPNRGVLRYSKKPLQRRICIRRVILAVEFPSG